MSVVFSGTNQGTFTSTGGNTIIQLRSGVDYIHVYNLTQSASGTGSSQGIYYYWQRGMAQASAIEDTKTITTLATVRTQITTGGFSLVDNTVNTPGNSVALTAISTATPPVVSTGNTAGLSNGDVVRLYNVTGAQQLGGIDFTIGAISANTSFTLAYMRAIAAGTTGTFRRIPYNPYFYPQTRVISKIGASTFNGSPSAIVTMTVTSQFSVGEEVRFIIPTVTATAFGMTQLNLVEAPIVAIGQADVDGVTNTITVPIDVTSFTAFAWPLTTNGAFTPPQVVPVGASMKTALASVPVANYLADSEINQGFIGISLPGGANSPGGAASDVIYWVAGKSYNGV